MQYVSFTAVAGGVTGCLSPCVKCGDDQITPT